MNFRQLKNNQGLTIIELIVSLAVSALLLMVVVSGTLFIQRYIADWKRRSTAIDELQFIRQEFVSKLRFSRDIEIYEDSLVLTSATFGKTIYTWHIGQLVKDERPLLSRNYLIEELAVNRYSLPSGQSDSILSPKFIGMYEVRVKVIDERENRDSIRFVVRNDYEFYKYSN